MTDLYREEILEHYKNPQNFGELENADQILEADNPMCGDSQKWYIKIEDTDAGQVISEISFTGEGCAISTAASSLLSEYIKGKSVLELKYITEEKMSELIGTKVTSGRIKCLMLPVQALRKLLTNS